MRRILKEEKISTVQGKERRKERDDEEARVIEHRVRSCFDFIAAETRFYNICGNFFYLKVKTKTMTPGMKGRLSNFLRVDGNRGGVVYPGSNSNSVGVNNGIRRSQENPSCEILTTRPS